MKLGNKEHTPEQPLIHVPINSNKLLQKVVNIVNSNEELVTIWKILNVNAIDRLKMTDHGSVHFHIVANIALRLLRILDKHEIPLSVVTNFGLTRDHAEVIVFLASVLHDTGMSISRPGHEEFSIVIANQLMREMLAFMPVEERTVVIAETLHAIISHRRNGKPITVEAGIVRIADALDMSQGRSRIPYNKGAINIHSVSAFAIDNVKISEGKNKPVRIDISLNNSAGIFQIDELLKEKLTDSGIEQYFEITAKVKGKSEKKLLSEFSILL